MTLLDLCQSDEGEKVRFANVIEFKNSLRKIGVTARETDRILEMVVQNKEG
eukprot:CAMPEP_0202968058 /NCGR_PEP_ID=MMETSP1396-20130829/13173_1 /ASSEMBLY_ACC=CAM_ASM_000872 /TAXON_ID= /ORGANISM="Pseudokeronopsis sp., Strain Brazil" /LENGTH=50 /DNA_ID=CAMNT_0049693895 /DNA_START=66 /DNA_END=218 /DNA_ORIENTATION=+